MKTTLNEILNKGVPTDSSQIFLQTEDFVTLFDNNYIKKILKDTKEKILKEMEDLYYVGDKENILDYLSITLDSKTLEKSLHISPIKIINPITLLLMTNEEIKNLGIDFDNAKKIMIQRTNAIKRCKTTEQLKAEFPPIYRLFETQLNMDPTIQEYKKFNKKIKSMPKDEVQIFLKEEAKKQSVDVITLLKKMDSSEVSIFEDFKDWISINFKKNIIRYPQLMEFCLKEKIPNIELSEKENKRITLYLLNEFLDNCEKSPEAVQENIFYISNHFIKKTTAIDSEFELHIPSTNKTVTEKTIYEEYKKILRDNPEIKVVDFQYTDFEKMTPIEVKNFMDLYFMDEEVNWNILEEKDIENSKSTIKTKYEKALAKGDEKTAKKELDYLELFVKKKEFFDSTDPFKRIVGKKAFDGYVGYIYKNGNVVLEKFYEDSKKKDVAKSHAIYVMNVNEFYSLTALSKSEVILKKCCNRIYHTGNWQDRVRSFINTGQQDKKLPSKVMSLLKKD